MEAQTSPQSLYAARSQRPEGGAPAQTGADRWARGAPAAAPRARSAPATMPDPTSRRAAGLAWRERAPLPLGAPALAAPPLSCPGRARHQSRRREVHVERGARSELRSTRRGCPRPPDPRPSDLGRPQESPSSGAASPPSRCPRCPPPAAVTPKSWHQTLATPCSAKPPRRPRGPAETRELRPPHLLGLPRPPGTWAAASAGHSPDDRVPRWGRPAARAPAAPGLGVPQPPLPEQALPAATSAAPAAAGETKLSEAARRAGGLQAAELAQDERQARAHGEARAAQRGRGEAAEAGGRGSSRDAEMRRLSSETQRLTSLLGVAGRAPGGRTGPGR